MRKRPKEVHNLNFTFGSSSDHPHKKFIKYFIDGKWLEPGPLEGSTEIIPEIPESLKIEVKNHITKLRKWNKRDKEWQRESAIEKIKQWRYYFADSLL